MIRINLADINKDQENRLDFEEIPGFLDIADDEFRFEDPVVMQVRLSVVGDLVVGNGRLETMVTCQCSRCLGIFKETIMVDDFTFEDKYVEGGSIDLTERVREDIIVRLSIQPLCRKDCKGLCCKCKKNLNEGDCTCNKPEVKDAKPKKQDLNVFDGLVFDHGKIDVKE